MAALMKKLVLVALVAGVALICENIAQAQTGIYRTAAIARYQPIRGNFTANNLARLQGMGLAINANGTFVFAVPNSTLSPVTGRWQRRGTSIVFSGTRTITIATTGLNRIDIIGQLDFVRGTPVLTLAYATASGTAARVNGVSFGSNSSNAFLAVLVLRKQ